ncbi:MAG: acylphosphatase [Patescibacteria group bacterium]
MQKRLSCQVFGRVQMVMFRDFVKRAARARGVAGSVKNNIDGSVSIVAEGEEVKLREILALAHRGPMFARVDRVEEKWSAPLGEFKSFDILYE